MEKLLWAAAAALGLAGVLLLIFSPIGKVIGLCVFALGCVLVAFLALRRWAQKKPKAAQLPSDLASWVYTNRSSMRSAARSST